jgi:small subunit ribosomal protein S16
MKPAEDLAIFTLHASPAHHMSVKIRLRRVGRKGTPMYRIVVADSRAARDGKFVEILGQYSPRQGKNAIALKSERANYWLDNGAQPSDTVRSLLRRAGVLKARHEQRVAAKLASKAVPVGDKAS